MYYLQLALHTHTQHGVLATMVLKREQSLLVHQVVALEEVQYYHNPAAIIAQQLLVEA
jgi:hypothetical protein